MPQRTARTTFVTMTHAKTKATGEVPVDAVKHYEAHGWKVAAKELKEAEAIEAAAAEPADTEPAKADETATADSKKNTRSN